MSADPSPPAPREAILIIRTGSVGDFVQALGAFSAIRMHHDGAEITLVANPTVVEFAGAAPYFDRVTPDPGTTLGLRTVIKETAFYRVYDLDTSQRTNLSYTLSKTLRQHLGQDPPVPWSGTAKGCSFPHTDPDRMAMHISDRLMSQLVAAGIEEHPPVSLAWVSRAVGTFSLPLSLSEPFILLRLTPAEKMVRNGLPSATPTWRSSPLPEANGQS